jgi:nicotinamidase-related amidase
MTTALLVIDVQRALCAVGPRVQVVTADKVRFVS